MGLFKKEIKIEISDSTEVVTDRLQAFTKSPKLSGDYERSLESRGKMIGQVSDSRFEISEAMMGFGGASIKGTISKSQNGTVLIGIAQPSMFARLFFIVMLIVNSVILYLVISDIDKFLQSSSAPFKAVFFLLALVISYLVIKKEIINLKEHINNGISAV